MAALLVGLSIMAVAMSMLMPAWQTMARREREAELIFRGEQYARAVALFQRSRGAFPPSIDVLVTEKFLRKKYADPMMPDGAFQVVTVGQALPGQVPPPGAGRGAAPVAQVPAAGQVTGRVAGAGGGPMLGVVSRSSQTSLRAYNGRTKYNEWAFVATQATTQVGTGAPTPGGRGVPTPGSGRGVPPTAGVGGRGIGGRGGPTPSGPGRGLQFPGPGTFGQPGGR
jgi:type II secretory pathway pseudopilin PulG